MGIMNPSLRRRPPLREFGGQMKAFRLIGCLLLASQLSGIAAAQDLRVAAAADLQFVFQEVSAQISEGNGPRLLISLSAPPGISFRRFRTARPLTCFSRLTLTIPRRLEVAGLVEPGTLSRYATGRIALWVRKGSPIDINQGRSDLSRCQGT